nr:hypothetical protein [Candidatus Freyarchaeota archaeon]
MAIQSIVMKGRQSPSQLTRTATPIRLNRTTSFFLFELIGFGMSRS